MEMFHIPLREIRKRFTLSEIVFISWRSQEQAYNLKHSTDKGGKPKTKTAKGGKARKEVDGYIPDGLPDHFFNDEGEVDLRQVKGEEARQYFAALGIQLPVQGVLRTKEGMFELE